MTSALITGISGMVGSHLADYLLAHTDWKIYGMLRWRSPLNNIAHILDRVQLLYGDLRDYISLDHVVGTAMPDYVFHLAAQSFPKTSFDSPFDTLDTNILGTSRLLEALRRRAPDPVIHVCSSSEVYGRVSRDQLPISEDCPFHPASPYAISKAGTDLLGRFHAEAYGQRIVTTRMFTHTGPRRGDVFAESSFAKQIAMAEAGRIPPVIRVGNLDSLRTWADVRDAVRAYYLLVTVDPTPGECYNIGGDLAWTIRQILDHLIEISTIKDEISVVVDHNRLRPIDADLQVPDTRKFSEHTGWKPEIPFSRTLADLLDDWRDRAFSREGLLPR